jgi:hypothetical protein
MTTILSSLPQSLDFGNFEVQVLGKPSFPKSRFTCGSFVSVKKWQLRRAGEPERMAGMVSRLLIFMLCAPGVCCASHWCVMKPLKTDAPSYPCPRERLR